ncbi:CC/Se motif family (seleno)protein [Tepidimicrobium xylanilyticum]|uniref:CC/Se motif family (seleno)protein n=1 Tax=Tepidimicrobium xylanilyticum TaxID=1123352 RepID=UPI00295EB401|nr:CC/Se motif family (seleno)protein [Tepidimicrobium xylanilyticum]
MEPSVEMVIPKDESLYHRYDIDGIRVYCSPEVRKKNDEIRLKLMRFFWIKYLYVD